MLNEFPCHFAPNQYSKPHSFHHYFTIFTELFLVFSKCLKGFMEKIYFDYL